MWEIILEIMISIIWTLGNIAMLICGALGISGHLDINLGGSIAMVVLGSLFGGLPFLRNLLSND